MRNFKRVSITLGVIFLTGFISACAPEIGSQQWCDDLDEVEKTKWSNEEAANYAQHCLFKSREED